MLGENGERKRWLKELESEREQKRKEKGRKGKEIELKK